MTIQQLAEEAMYAAATRRILFSAERDKAEAQIVELCKALEKEKIAIVDLPDVNLVFNIDGERVVGTATILFTGYDVEDGISIGCEGRNMDRLLLEDLYEAADMNRLLSAVAKALKDGCYS